MFYSILFELGWLSLAILIAPANVKGLVISAGIVLALRLLYGKKKNNRKKNTAIGIILALLFSCILEIRFYGQWKYSSTLQIIDHLVSLKEGSFSAVVGIILCLLFSYTFLCLLQNYDEDFENDVDKVGWKEKIVLAVIAIGIVSIFSKSSVLYPFNDWVDSNAYMTVGKSILHGMVPYRDLFEQKGPILYFLHALCAVVSDTSFVGIYVVEMITCWFFLYYSYKILGLYHVKHKSVCLLFSAVVIYSSKCFEQGDSVEELCLPLLAAMLYIGLQAIKEGKQVSAKDAVYTGVSAGIILWTKFTILGFYIGWGLFFVIYYLYKKWGKQLLKAIGLVLAGLLAVTGIVLIYFGINHAVKDLFEVYFYDNIFHYTATDMIEGNSSTLSTVYHSAVTAFGLDPLYFLLIYIGLALNAYVAKKQSVFLIVCYVTASFFTLFGIMRYYNLALAVFVPIGTGLIAKTCFTRDDKRIYRAAVTVVLCVLVGLQSPNLYMLKEKKEDLVQFSFAKIIDASEDRTLLNYGFLDGGFYTAADVVPNVKYFMVTNGMHRESQEAQDEYVKEAKTEFVVTAINTGRESSLLAENYHLVAEQDGIADGIKHVYRLYQRND